MTRRLSWPLFALALLGCASRDSAAVPKPANAATLQPTAAKRPAADSTSAVLAKADAGRIMGNASATVWLIIISDFQCPFCKRWHDESWEAIRKEYVETGKIRVAYVNLPLEMHRNAWPAANAAMCASIQDKFWPMQDELLRAQQQWEQLADPQQAFEALAGAAGANIEALRACMKSDVMRPLIQGDAERASNAGARSTPTFFVAGRAVIGAQPLAAFREAIDAALAAKPAGK